MSLKIEQPFIKDEFVKANDIKFQIRWFKYKKQMIRFSIAAAVLLAIGILSINDYQPLNGFIFFGGGAAVLSVFMLFRYLSTKRKFTAQVDALADKFELEQMDCTFEFNDDKMSYKDKEKRFELNWSLFSHYFFFKDYLIVVINNAIIDTFIFKKFDDDDDDIDKVIEFIKDKVKHKPFI